MFGLQSVNNPLGAVHLTISIHQQTIFKELKIH